MFDVRYLFRHEITSTSPVTFIWAFQKRSSEATTVSADSHVLRDDVARIFEIDVTNTRVGGAEACTVCPQGASQDGLALCLIKVIGIDNIDCAELWIDLHILDG